MFEFITALTDVAAHVSHVANVTIDIVAPAKNVTIDAVLALANVTIDI